MMMVQQGKLSMDARLALFKIMEAADRLQRDTVEEARNSGAVDILVMNLLQIYSRFDRHIDDLREAYPTLIPIIFCLRLLVFNDEGSRKILAKNSEAKERIRKLAKLNFHSKKPNEIQVNLQEAGKIRKQCNQSPSNSPSNIMVCVTRCNKSAPSNSPCS